MSWKCRPVVGSSRMYSVRPVSRLDSSSASLTRCASPPDSVVGALAERDVAQAHVEQRLQLARDGRHRAEELVGLLHRQSAAPRGCCVPLYCTSSVSRL